MVPTEHYDPDSAMDKARGKVGALDYDVVIATRNRPEALALSIPLLIGQTKPPKRLIVIDSSEDHAPIADAVAAATLGWDGEVIVEHSGKGLPHQRNRGLSHVVSDIVLFPDDDSLLYYDAAEQMLSVYERDHDHEISAVCAIEAREPPPEASLGQTYGMSGEHLREAKSRGWRTRLVKRFPVLKPAPHLGRMLNARHKPPAWIGQSRVTPVEYMTGFRMSFRRSAIAEAGFDEALGGYALDEDIDASFTAMRFGVVVCARDARIYHHRFPSGRGDGHVRGRMEVLNRIYVVRKHVPPASQEFSAILWAQWIFPWIKLAAMLPGIRSRFGRQRIVGTWSAIRASRRLWSAEIGDLPAAYRTAFEESGRS